MDNGLKSYKDENIIALIGKMESGEIPYDLNDLKTFMTEATDRQLPQGIIDRLGVLIKNEILKDVVSTSDYRKNAEINYAEQFGDDEPVSSAEEEKIEEPKEEPAAAEETKVVPIVDENGVAPLEIPEEVMRAPIPEIMDSQNISETVPDKLDVLEEMAVETDIEKLREKTKKQKKKDEKIQKFKEETMKKIPIIKDSMLNKEPEIKAEEVISPAPEKPVKEVKKAKNKKVKEVNTVIPDEEKDEYDDYYEFEAFPVLSFVAGFYKVLGWIAFVGIIAAGLAVSIFNFIDNIPLIAGIMAGCVVGGTIVLLMFYASSESISLKIEIERHLRRLDRE